MAEDIVQHSEDEIRARMDEFQDFRRAGNLRGLATAPILAILTWGLFDWPPFSEAYSYWSICGGYALFYAALYRLQSWKMNRLEEMLREGKDIDVPRTPPGDMRRLLGLRRRDDSHREIGSD